MKFNAESLFSPRLYYIGPFFLCTENNQALNGRPNDLTPWKLTLIQKP